MDEFEKASSDKMRADICFEISRRYSSALKIDSAIWYADKTKTYSEKINYETGIGKYHLAYGDAMVYRGRNEESEKNALKAIEIFSRQKEDQMLGHSYNQLAYVQFVTNRISLSRNNYWKAIGYFIPANNSSGLFMSYYRLARSYFKTSEADSAVFYYVKALSMAEVLNDANRIYHAACLAGGEFLSMGDLSNAIKYYDRGLKTAPARADRVSLRNSLKDFAICLSLTHQFSRADSVTGEIDAMNKILGDGYGIVIISRIKGTMEFEKENYPQAVHYLTQAFNKATELKTFNSEMKDILLLLGRAEYETKQYDSALAHLRFAVQIAVETRQMTDERDAFLFISRSYQQKGKTDSAFYYFKNYSLLKDSILSAEKQKSIIEVTTRYETEKKEQEISILQKKDEANLYLLQLKNQQLEKQQLEDEKKSQQLSLISKQNEINQLDATQKSLSLDVEKKENERNQARLKLLEQEAAYQKLTASKQNQQKQFAFLVAGLIVLLGGYGYYRYRQHKNLSKQLNASLTELKLAQEQLIKTEKEKEAENLRVRISQDIHDEVGATLSGVALFSEIAKQKIEQQQQAAAQEVLGHISTNSKEMVEKISEIVWAINPENDSFERIIEKLRAYAFNLCAGKNITLHASVDKQLSNYHPSMEVKRHLYLLIKEAVNNAIKYSGAKNIFLSLWSEGKTVVSEIRDDGAGFDSTQNYSGNGLKNMKARAESLHAILTIDSQKGKGTVVRFGF